MDQRESQEVPPGIGHSIRPDVPVPDTVLVAVMSDGSYLLMGYPQREPAAFVIAEDAGSLRQALEAAFGNPTDQTRLPAGTATATGQRYLEMEPGVPRRFNHDS